MTSNGHPPGARVVSIFDYPEHLNPFYEDDNHNKIRFWTLGKKKARSNSFSLSGIRNAMTLRSFRGKKGMKVSSQEAQQSEEPIFRSKPGGNLSRSTQSVPCAAEDAVDPRYVYGGSVTPTPLPRFQHYNGAQPPRAEENRSSRLSVNSSCEQTSGKPPRPYRKKRRAPPPPIFTNMPDISLDDESLKTELKIIEDPKDDIKPTEIVVTPATPEPPNNLEIKNETENPDKSLDAELKIDEENSNADQKSKEREAIDVSNSEHISGEDSSKLEAVNEVNSITLQISEVSKTAVENDIEQKNESSTPSSPDKVSRDIEPVETVDVIVISSVKENDLDVSTASKEEVKCLGNKQAISPPTPKTRTIIPAESAKPNLVSDIGVDNNCQSIINSDAVNSNEVVEEPIVNGETVNNAKAIEELDKCTKEINEILRELDDTPATNLEVQNDDTNNNQMPAWSSFYRSVTTVSDGKHRAEINNVQLNSSPENSLEIDLNASTLKN